MGPGYESSLLDGTRVMATLPADLPGGLVKLGISLNGGTDGTFSNDTVDLKLYKQPSLYGVQPTQGDANGGSAVTVSGSGFSALGDIPEHSVGDVYAEYVNDSPLSAAAADGAGEAGGSPAWPLCALPLLQPRISHRRLVHMMVFVVAHIAIAPT